MNCFSFPTGNASRARDHLALPRERTKEGDRARFHEAFHVSLRAPGSSSSAGPRSSSDSLEKKFRGKIDDGKKSWEKRRNQRTKEYLSKWHNNADEWYECAKVWRERVISHMYLQYLKETFGVANNFG